jgi:hypothetical protein
MSSAVRDAVKMCMIVALIVGPAGGGHARDSKSELLFEQEVESYAGPIYSLVLYTDGLVRYHGKRCVLPLGSETRRIATSDVHAIYKAFNRFGFKNLSGLCCRCRGRTHAQTFRTTLHSAREPPKTIVHYRGCVSAPRRITKLEHELQRILEVDSWIQFDSNEKGCSGDPLEGLKL